MERRSRAGYRGAFQGNNSESQVQNPKDSFELSFEAQKGKMNMKKLMIAALAISVIACDSIKSIEDKIDAIAMPKELGVLEPAGRQLNGPSAKVLDENILAPLGYTRKDAWLCDCLPETRINSSQAKVIRERYNPLIEKYGLNPVTIPTRPTSFCDHKRAEEITAELMESQAELFILLGDIPIAQYLKKVADIPYSTLGEYVDLYGYGNITETVINGKIVKVLPLAHLRQIGALGAHSEKWCQAHRYWENNR